jgi:hypothetical protein
MSSKGLGSITALLICSISFLPAFAITETQVSVDKPRLVTAFGALIGNDVTVNQQFQISADITNHQKKSQNFHYLVQIKDENNFVVSLGWISGQLTPTQKFSPSLSWTPEESGEFTAEIFVWEGFPVNAKALSKYITLPISVG